MIVKCADTIRAVLDVDIEQYHRKQEFSSATALLFTSSFLTLFVTNVKAMKGVVYSYRKTRFFAGKKEIFNVGLN